MMELFSKYLPNKGCMTPLHAHLTPSVVFAEKDTINERINGNAVDLSRQLYQFYFLSQPFKKYLVAKAGFTQEKLESFLT